MAINFPAKPQPDGKEYVDPDSGKWVYDLDNNSWTLVAPGNVSPFNYRGGHDFNSATAPTNVKSGDAWTHSGTDGAAINAAYIGMTGTIAAGQFVVFDGSEYTKVSSVAGYPNVGDGDGATLDTRYVKKKGETEQGIEGSIGIGVGTSSARLTVKGPAFDAASYGKDLRVTNIGSLANEGHAEGEGPTLAFGLTRYSDGAIKSAGYIRALAEFDLQNSWPTSLTFGTQRFGSDPVEHMRLASTGYLGIGAEDPNAPLHIQNNAAGIHLDTFRNGTTYGNSSILFSNPRSDTADGVSTGGRGLIACLGNSAGTTGVMWFLAASASLGGQDSDSDLKKKQAGLRLDSGGALEMWKADNLAWGVAKEGNMYISPTRPRAVGGRTAKFNVEGTSSATGASYVRNAANNAGPGIVLCKSRGADPGTNGQVRSGDDLGLVIFSGSDGTSCNAQGAFIRAKCGGAVVEGKDGNTARVPGQLAFHVTPEDTSKGATPSEAVRIDQDGTIVVASNSSSASSRVRVRGLYPETPNANGVRVDPILTAANTGGNCCFYINNNSQDNGGTAYTVSSSTLLSLRSSPLSPDSTLNELYGLTLASSLNTAATNYGVYANISPREVSPGVFNTAWNLYVKGSAPNYSVSSFRFGTESALNPASNETNGIEIDAPTKVIRVSRAGGPSLVLQRTDSDGTVIDFYRGTTAVGSVTTNATNMNFDAGPGGTFTSNSDYRLKENIAPLTSAVDRVKALKPCRFNYKVTPDQTVDGFIAHEAQGVVPEAVTGTKDAVEAIGTLLDWDGTVLEEGVAKPADCEMTYEVEVEDTAGVAAADPVWSEPELIQEYQPAVYGDPELVSAAKAAVFDDQGNLVQEEVPAEWSEPPLISPEVPEKWTEPELISPEVKEVQPTYKTVTREKSWKKTGERDVMQGIDQSKLVPLLTAALQEALGRIEALEAAIASKGA